MFGEISYDRAADELFDKNNDDETVKGLALLLRRNLGKTDDDKQDVHIKSMIDMYVKSL